MIQWIYPNNKTEISQELSGVPVSILKIIKGRGVPEEKFEDFLSDKPVSTYDPFLIPDLKATCERIISAADEGKSFCVYGDYDADGVTSTALMVSLLRHFTHKVSYYIPSRFEDGYGPNIPAFKRLKEAGADFLITVDCGITSANEIEYAKSIGFECIVTDHHILREGMTPDCLTVNPHREDSKYPYADLSGCGVAFKVAQGIQRILAERNDHRFTKSDLNEFLDLVAISTVADVVPLLDENRALVKYGLDRINRMERPGLKALIIELDLDIPLDSNSISFVLAPNINALGRIDRADKGVELLTETNREKLKEIAKDIVDTNKKRKEIQEDTASICRAALEKGSSGDYAPVIYAPGAHEGVAGIVAGSLKEELNKPVCIVSPVEDGSLKGTGRSIQGINLHALFENCGDVFERFGGHAGACGFTVKNDKLEEFRSNIQQLVKQLADEDPSIFDKKIYIEKELDAKEKTLDFAENLEKLAPFGEANPVPLFSISNVTISNLRCIGSEGQHLRFNAKGKDGIIVQCICFRGSNNFSYLADGDIVDVAGELRINSFRGRKNLQIVVADIRA